MNTTRCFFSKRFKKISLVNVYMLILVATLIISCTKDDYKFHAEEKQQKLTAPEGSQVEIEQAALDLYNDTRTGGYRLIHTKELLRRIEENEDIVIIDTRSKTLYNQKHIKGAINITAPSLSDDQSAIAVYSKNLNNTISDFNIAKDKKEHIQVINKYTPLVFYSSSLVDRRSSIAAVQAIRLGYKFVYRMPAGFATWDESKYPTK